VPPSQYINSVFMDNDVEYRGYGNARRELAESSPRASRKLA
jgi:hypothetical protein